MITTQDKDKDKDMFDFSNYASKSKYYNDSKKLVVDRKKY